MALNEKDISIITQNAGTQAASIVAALFTSGQVTLGEGDTIETVVQQVSDVRRALTEDAVRLIEELAPEAPAAAAQGAVVRAFPGAQAQGAGSACPKCAGEMWDNRADKAAGKANPKAPDFKCKDKANCDGVIWPPR